LLEPLIEINVPPEEQSLKAKPIILLLLPVMEIRGSIDPVNATRWLWLIPDENIVLVFAVPLFASFDHPYIVTPSEPDIVNVDASVKVVSPELPVLKTIKSCVPAPLLFAVLIAVANDVASVA